MSKFSIAEVLLVMAIAAGFLTANLVERDCNWELPEGVITAQFGYYTYYGWPFEVLPDDPHAYLLNYWGIAGNVVSFIAFSLASIGTLRLTRKAFRRVPSKADEA